MRYSDAYQHDIDEFTKCWNSKKSLISDAVLSWEISGEHNDFISLLWTITSIRGLMPDFLSAIETRFQSDKNWILKRDQLKNVLDAFTADPDKVIDRVDECWSIFAVPF